MFNHKHLCKVKVLQKKLHDKITIRKLYMYCIVITDNADVFNREQCTVRAPIEAGVSIFHYDFFWGGFY